MPHVPVALTLLTAMFLHGGLVHLGVIGLAMLIFGGRGADTKMPNKILASTVEKPEDEKVENLENEDKGFDPSIASALPDQEREADKTSVGVASEDPVGVPNTEAMDNNALAAVGFANNESSNPGALGKSGDVIGGEGGAGGPINAAFAGRSGATKSKLLGEGGGNKDSELAVALGLKWLAQQQKGGGFWEFDGGETKGKAGDRATATGMSLLPFLAAGITPRSAGSKYQKTVADGLNWLKMDVNISTGKYGHVTTGYMYGHAIATMALCEAYGMTKERSLLQPAQAAVQYIIKAQAADGSWGYAAGTAGDTSIVGWQIQALRAAQLTKDIQVPDAVLTNAKKFLDRVSGNGSLKSTYGYTGPTGAPGTALTAVGLLSRYYADGWGPNHPGMADGVPGLFGRPKADATVDSKTDRTRAPKTADQIKANKSTPELYYYYYATQVVHFYGGKVWQEWNEGPRDANGKRQGGMRDWLITTQSKAGNNAGSWDADGGHIGRSCGRLGSTCLCLLTLEVYYRHLPLYKRNAGAAD